MGMNRLPRDIEEQKRWARQLLSGLNIPPIAVLRTEGQPLRQAYHQIFRHAYQLGALAALREVLSELERSDDPLAGLKPQYVKSAKAAAQAHARKRAARSEESPRRKATA